MTTPDAVGVPLPLPAGFRRIARIAVVVAGEPVAPVPSVTATTEAFA